MTSDWLLALLGITLLLAGVAIAVAIFSTYKYLSIKAKIPAIEREMEVKLEQWKNQSEQSIRQDARQRSRSVILGQATQHLSPYLPGFSYSPKDARFIGEPVDFVVFDGLNEGEVRKIVLVEVKTGTSQLKEAQKQIRDAIRSGGVTVEWKEIRHTFEAGELPIELDEGNTALSEFNKEEQANNSL